MNEKQKRIIKVVKQHHLYTPYRALLNNYLDQYDRREKILMLPTAETFFEAIREENIGRLINLLRRLEKTHGALSIKNLRKNFLYQTKSDILK